MKNKLSGIYLIKNLTNNKIYVGSSHNIVYRWSNHRTYLRKGNHHNLKLQLAWNKYGEKAFDFSILEIVNSLDELPIIEQKWIDKLKASDRTLGYNILPFAFRQDRLAKQCSNCKRFQKPLRKGRCHNCNEYLRRYNKERPFIQNGKTEKTIETLKAICVKCNRPLSVAGVATKEMCKSCYRRRYNYPKTKKR